MSTEQLVIRGNGEFGQNGVEVYNLPSDSDWETLRDVPTDFVQITELQMMAKADGAYVSDVDRDAVSLDDVFETYDDWNGGQTVLLARDEDGDIVGMLAYYLEKDGTPFFESVAVDPTQQRAGIGDRLIRAGLDKVHTETGADAVVAQAQARVVAFYERHYGAEVISIDQKTGRALIRVPTT